MPQDAQVFVLLDLEVRPESRHTITFYWKPRRVERRLDHDKL